MQHEKEFYYTLLLGTLEKLCYGSARRFYGPASIFTLTKVI